MARTESNIVQLGKEATEFTLLEPLEDEYVTLTSQKSNKSKCRKELAKAILSMIYWTK